MNPGDNGRNDSLIFDKFSFCTFKKNMYINIHLKLLKPIPFRCVPAILEMKL